MRKRTADFLQGKLLHDLFVRAPANCTSAQPSSTRERGTGEEDRQWTYIQGPGLNVNLGFEQPQPRLFERVKPRRLVEFETPGAIGTLQLEPRALLLYVWRSTGGIKRRYHGCYQMTELPVQYIP